MSYMRDSDGKRLDALVIPLSPAAWFGQGDSIMRGSGSRRADLLTDTDYRGFFVEACEAAVYGYCFAPFFGEQGANFYLTRHYRLGGTEYTTHALDEYGQNDWNATGGGGSLTLAVLQANAIKRWVALRDRQQVVYAVTITPRTTTTTAWGTVAGQATVTNESIRTAYNDWMRAGAPVSLVAGDYPTAATVGTSGRVLLGEVGHPLSGLFDVSNAVESGLNSGKWKAAERTVTDAAMTSGSATITSATATFAAGDVGKTVNVQGAGAAGAGLTVQVSSVTDAQTAVLSQAAATTVSATGLAVDPWTVDGVHPSQRGHMGMATACDLAAAVTSHPPRVLREWVPMAHRSNGNNGGLTSARAGGTSRIMHPIVGRYAYSAVRFAYGNWVGTSQGPATLGIRCAVEISTRSYSARFGNTFLGRMFPGQPLLVSDPIAIDVRSTPATLSVFSRTEVVDLLAVLVTASTDTLTFYEPHGLSVGDTYVPPSTVGNLTGGTTYYVQTVVSSTAIKVATTLGGAVLDLTTDGLSVSQIPTGLAMRGAVGDASNFTSGGKGVGLTGTGWYTTPAAPTGVTSNQAFSPHIILGRVAN